MSENNSSKWGLIKKAFYIWAVQYHFVIPKEILKGYVHKFHTESDNIAKYGKRFYNPEDSEEYNTWLSFQTYDKSEEALDVTFVGEEVETLDTAYPKQTMQRLDLTNVQTKYTCIVNDQVIIYPMFYQYLYQCKEHDVTYFDSDINNNSKRKNPHLKPDFSYNTLRGFNYIGNVWVVKTELLKQFDGNEWNPYRWLLELSDQKICWGHVEKILYGEKDEYHSELETLKTYVCDHHFNIITKQNQDQVSVDVSYPLVERPLVSIIIPTRNGKDILQTCIDSIMTKTTYDNYEIVIADNGSDETTTLEYFKEIEEKYKNIHVVDCHGVFNFSKINNQAIQSSHGKYIIMLNNDTSIITSDWIEKMLSYAQLDHVGSVGVLMYYPDGTIQHGGVISGKGGGFAHRYYRKPRDEKEYMYTLSIPNDVVCCTAACLMIPKDKYDEVGGMNEGLTVQFNDVDLGIRLLEHGYSNVFMPTVQLVHYESKSRGIDKDKSAVERYVNEVTYAKEHYGKYIEHDPFYNDNFDKNYDYKLIVGKGSN